MILVCFLSFRRAEYLAQTVNAFIQHNQALLGTTLKMIALDQCTLQDTVAVFKDQRRHFEKVYTTTENHGIGWGFSQLVELSRIYRADFILYLEDDWLCQLPLEKHLQGILQLFRTRPDVGTTRLRTMEDAVATVNHATAQPVQTERWQESFLIGNYHYVFNPHLVRMEVARSMIPVSSEHHAQLCYHALGLQAAQLADTMFVHIGQHRAPGRISRVPAPRPVLSCEWVAQAKEFVVALPIKEVAGR